MAGLPVKHKKSIFTFFITEDAISPKGFEDLAQMLPKEVFLDHPFVYPGHSPSECPILPSL